MNATWARAEIWARARLCAAGLFALAAASSCQKPAGLPAPPEFASAQRAMWQLAPADAQGGVVIADFGHLLGRLRAFRAVLETGPSTRSYLAKGTAAAVKVLGFDPLDAEGWRKAGLEPDGPLALFIGTGKDAQLLFRASDVARATSSATTWVGQGGGTDPFGCAPAGTYLRCGTPDWKLANEAGQSLWPHLSSNLGSQHLGMELLVYAPLDRGEAQQALAKTGAPVKGLHAAYFGLTAAPERLIVRTGARVEDAAKVLPYLAPRDGGSLLGIAAGGVQAGRITFSPDALWALGSQLVGAVGPNEIALFQTATGLDLMKDVVENLSGEIVFAGYRSARKQGADGKPRSFADRLSSITVVGMRDDVRTRHVANRVGEMLGGAAGSFAQLGDTMGVKVEYTSEPGDRPVHRFRFEFSGQMQERLGMARTELFITSTPGGVAVGFGLDGLDELRRHAAGKREAFLASLPLPEERALFERSPFAFWGRTGDGFGARLRLGAAAAALDTLYPEASKVLVELVEVAQLIYDTVAGFDVTADRAEMFYQVSFL